MSMEFAVEFSCPARRMVSEEQLRELSRLASINARVVDSTLSSSSPPAPELILFVERSRKKLQILDQILPICSRCPANLEHPQIEYPGETIGCLGRINYPIDDKFEHFLANRLQLIFDTVDAEYWPRALHVLLDSESTFDGEATKELRRMVTSDGLRFFELRTPIQLHRKGASLTTDNIFDLLAGFSSTDRGATSYQREIPALAMADFHELMEAILGNLSNEERDRLLCSRSMRQYMRLAEAIRRADELQVRLLID